ncbi:MAG: outer membrane protein transport protein [Balneolaceae bacterium]
MRRIIVCLTGVLLLTFGFSLSGHAQEANNPLLYSYQAVQFSDRGIAQDPVTLVMPGTALGTGFGSYQDNPASAAFFDESFGTFGLAFRSASEENTFLGNTLNSSDNQTSISNAGFVYNFPVTRGRLLIGAGYSQHSFYNRALELSGTNNATTITDQFKIPGSTYSDIAFNTYAIDFGDEIGDWDESIFRIGFDRLGDYLGIDQEAEILQRGFAGEYSAFLATEFQRNLMVGLSLGIQAGRHTYDRVFLEVDRDNLYDGTVIDSNEDEVPDTDMDSVLLSEEIRNNYLSFQARAGMIYRVNSHLNVGASYTFPTRLTVDEIYDSRISTTFDNGEGFEDDLAGEYSYEVQSPARVNIGFAFVDIGGISASFSAGYTDFSKTRVEFGEDEFEAERDENQFISDQYKEVWDVRGGISMDLTDQFTLRAGYGYQPSRFKNMDLSKSRFSAGAGFALTENTRLEVGAQYSLWKEESVVYNYGVYDYSALPDLEEGEGHLLPVSIHPEVADRDVGRLQILATLRIRLY